MKFFLIILISLYVQLTFERTIPNLTQIQSKDLDILADKEIHSVKSAHNIDKKIETASFNVTTTTKPSIKKNDKSRHVLRKGFQNESLYENVQNKENDVKERSFVFIDTKYKVPYQNVLRRNYIKPLNYRDINPYTNPLVSPGSDYNFPNSFLDDNYTEEPTKIYIDPHANPNTAYVQPSKDQIHKMRAITHELRKLESKVKAANAFIDSQYNDVKSNGNVLDMKSMAPHKIAHMPFVRPETAVFNQYNKPIKTTDVIDRYINYVSPGEKWSQSNKFVDNLFEYPKQFEYRKNLPMGTFERPDVKDSFFAKALKTPDGNSYTNKGDLSEQNILQAYDFRNRFQGGLLNENHLISHNRLSHIEPNLDNYEYLSDKVRPIFNSRYNIGKLHSNKENEYRDPNLKNNYIANDLQSGMKKSYFESGQYLPSKSSNGGTTEEIQHTNFDSNKINGKASSGREILIPNALGNNKPNNWNGISFTNSYLNDASRVDIKNKFKLPDLKNKFESDSNNETKYEKSVLKALKDNYYLRGLIPNITEYKELFMQKNPTEKHNIQAETDTAAGESHKTNQHTYNDNSRSSNQYTSPTIEIQHPGSKNDYLTIRYRPTDYNDNTIIKIHPSSHSVNMNSPINISDPAGNARNSQSSDDFTTSFQHPEVSEQIMEQPRQNAANNIELFPRLNEIFPSMKQNNPNSNTDGKANQISSKTAEEEKPKKGNRNSSKTSKLAQPDLTEDNEEIMKLPHEDSVFNELSKTLDEFNDANSDDNHVALVTDKPLEDYTPVNTLVRRITNKSIVITSKPTKQACVYPDCMEKAMFNSDSDNPICECEYAIKQNMATNSDYRDLEISVPSQDIIHERTN